MPIAVAHAVTKHLGPVRALHNASLSVQQGRAFGLLGPNGAGKTTMVRTLTGLLTPDSGAVELFGTTLTATSDALRARVGVQTDTNVYELLTTEQNLLLWAQLYGLSDATARRRIDELLTQFDLRDKRTARAGTLSKGMRQKLGVARALLHEPELLFLDEPTAGLDPAAADELILHLRTLIQSGSTTVVLCTHQLRGLETLVDDLAFIRGGEIVASGTVSELLNTRWPGASYTLRFAGDDELIRTAAKDALQSITEQQAEFTFPNQDAAAAFLTAIAAAGVRVFAFTPRERTIHDLYLDTVLEPA